MALDTRSRRASALGTMRPWLISPAFPDGTLDQGDRQHSAFMYSGILALPSVIALHPGITFSAPSDDLTFLAPPDGDFIAPRN